ncbi:MAG: hypothetical protein Q8R69_27410 [Telluria sp.]|nr:hypothetical protein [Telluria sp.]
MWIIKQAQLQGIQVYTARIKKFEWDIVTNPILHDKSGNRDMPYNSPMIADRAFIYEGGQRIKQARANIGGTTTDWARTFVSYYIFACGPGHSPAVGQVDMKKYSEWLGSQGVQIGFQVPKTSKVCN